MRNHYKEYKYICHLHIKRSAHKLYLGSNWSEYSYKNLIGNKRIINDIFTILNKMKDYDLFFLNLIMNLLKLFHNLII